MKKYLSSLALMFLLALSASAQHRIIIELGDTTIKRFVSEVKSITFDEFDTISVSKVEFREITPESAQIQAWFAGSLSKATEFGIVYDTSESALVGENVMRKTVDKLDSDGSCIFTLNNLSSRTTYYFKIYVITSTLTDETRVDKFITGSDATVPEAIDLGLSVKWASWNVGATQESEYGLYIGWGDPTGKNESTDYMSYPEISNIAGSEYDVTTRLWGSEWRMPTRDEWNELLELPRVDTICNGKKGLLIKGTNGNTLFLPYAGYKSSYTNLKDGEGEDAYYWTAEQVDERSSRAYKLFPTSKQEQHFNKASHLPVRGVTGTFQPKARVESVKMGNCDEATASIVAKFAGNLDKASEFGICYATSEADLASSNPNAKKITVSSVASTGEHTFNLSNLSASTTYYYFVYVTTASVTQKSNIASFTTLEGGPFYVYVKSVELANVSGTVASIKVSFEGRVDKPCKFGLNYATTKELLATRPTRKDINGVDADGTCTVNVAGLEPETKYYYYAYVQCDNKDTCEVDSFTTSVMTYKFPVPKMVDLGLESGTLWAEWNMGAESVYDYGDYMAWGDPTGENMSYKNTDYPSNVKSLAGTAYDVATVQWGEGWQMPTVEQWKELGALRKKNVTVNGVMGLLITGNNGNTLFLPMGGHLLPDGTKEYVGINYSWASENATMVSVGVEEASVYPNSEKAFHLTVRPVYVAPAEPEKMTPEGEKVEYVDMGTGCLWATTNLGATSEDDCGYYYAWADTVYHGSGHAFTKENYLYYNAETETIRDFDAEGKVFISGTDRDAATHRLGGKWRTPTKADWEDLIRTCEWKPDNNGIKVIAPNGNSIYLPATGVYNSSELKSSKDQCIYMTSDFATANPNEELYYIFVLRENNVRKPFLGYLSSYCGFAIRPVRSK